MSPLEARAQRVADELSRREVAGPFREFADTTKTAVDAARALDCEVGAIASSLVFVIDEEPVVVLKSGADRIDLARLAAIAGGRLARQARPEEVRSATGQSPGGVSPVNWPGPLRVFIDVALEPFERVWAACGTPHAVFATSYAELILLTDATPIQVRAN